MDQSSIRKETEAILWQKPRFCQGRRIPMTTVVGYCQACFMCIVFSQVYLAFHVAAPHGLQVSGETHYQQSRTNGNAVYLQSTSDVFL